MVSRTAIYLIVIHVLITVTGLLFHLGAHNPTQSLYFWWAAPVSAFNLLIVSGLYLHPRTVAWGVLANAMTVAIGVIGMTYFSIKTVPPPYTPVRILLHSTMAYSLLLLTKIPLAELIRQEVGRSDRRET